MSRGRTVAAFATEAATEATVEECLRFDPPLHLFPRYAQEDVEVAGVRLRAGNRGRAALRRRQPGPGPIPEAHVFNPAGLWRDRRRGHAAFGGGIHFCLGAPLARLELQVALPMLFARLPGIHLKGRPRYRDAYHFHGLEALNVGWP